VQQEPNSDQQPADPTEEFIVQRQGHIATHRSLPRQGWLACVGAAAFVMNERQGSTEGRRTMGPLGEEDETFPGKGGA
jgi:hypothetical protein